MADLLAVLSAHTKLNRMGPKEYWGRCPFCGMEATVINTRARAAYHCFGCHRHLTADEVIEQLSLPPDKKADD